MKKVFLVAAFTVAAFVGVNAQKEFKLGAGINVNLPLGNAGDISSFAIGGEFQGEYNFQEQVKGLATVGYTHFLGKEFSGYKVNYGIIPILVGARYYPSTQFFFGGQIGYGKFTGDYEGGGFAYKPHVGYDAGKYQLSLSYNGVSDNGTVSWLGLSGIVKF